MMIMIKIVNLMFLIVKEQWGPKDPDVGLILLVTNKFHCQKCLNYNFETPMLYNSIKY